MHALLGVRRHLTAAIVISYAKLFLTHTPIDVWHLPSFHAFEEVHRLVILCAVPSIPTCFDFEV